MRKTNEEIEESQVGVALAADDSATPYDLNELSVTISDIDTIVSNFCKNPTKGKKTRG